MDQILDEIQKSNFKIKKIKELIQIADDEEYFKIKKNDLDLEIQNLNKQKLEQELDALRNHVNYLKKNKPFLTVYNNEIETEKISLEQVQQFILELFDCNLSEVKFCCLKNKELIEKIHIYVIEDSKLSTYLENKLKDEFEFLIYFDYDENWLNKFLILNVINSSFVKQKNDNSLKKKIYKTDLILSYKQLLHEGYTLPILFDKNVRTLKKNYSMVSNDSFMFSLDCEMCLTSTNEFEVTKISLVDENLTLLYDKYVKPKNKIIDYLTRYSGITEDVLKNVTTTLEDVLEELDKILPPDAILVGHSLNCDFKSLGVSHPYVIDTSCIYNFTTYRCYKPSLKQLCKKFLNKEIQKGDNGHCSIEDAKYTMKLVQLKLSKNINFGDNVFSRHLKKNDKLTLAEYLKIRQKLDVKVYYDYLETQNLKKFILVMSIHHLKILEFINLSLSHRNSICVLIIKGKLFINLNK